MGDRSEVFGLCTLSGSPFLEVIPSNARVQNSETLMMVPIWQRLPLLRNSVRPARNMNLTEENMAFQLLLQDDTIGLLIFPFMVRASPVMALFSDPAVSLGGIAPLCSSHDLFYGLNELNNAFFMTDTRLDQDQRRPIYVAMQNRMDALLKWYEYELSVVTQLYGAKDLLFKANPQLEQLQQQQQEDEQGEEGGEGGKGEGGADEVSPSSDDEQSPIPPARGFTIPINELTSEVVESLSDAYGRVMLAFLHRYTLLHELLALQLSGARLKQPLSTALNQDEGGSDNAATTDGDDGVEGYPILLSDDQWPIVDLPVNAPHRFVLQPVPTLLWPLLTKFIEPDMSPKIGEEGENHLWGPAVHRFTDMNDFDLLEYQFRFTLRVWVSMHVKNIHPDLFSKEAMSPMLRQIGMDPKFLISLLQTLTPVHRKLLVEGLFLEMLQPYLFISTFYPELLHPESPPPPSAQTDDNASVPPAEVPLPSTTEGEASAQDDEMTAEEKKYQVESIVKSDS